MTAQRKNDATLLIRQNNDAKTLTFVEVDEPAAELLGGPAEQFKEKSLFDFLAPKSIEYFSDAMDYEPDGADFSEASQKLRDLRLRDTAGKEFTSAFRVDRVDSPDGHAWFRLVFPSGQKREVREILTQYLHEHFDGAATINEETKLPSGNAAEAYAEMLRNTLPGHGISGCTALLRLDRYEKSLARYGRSGVVTQLIHVANCCRSTFRTEDIVCQIDDHTLAMFLVDIDQDAARIVLNRLRWNIRNHRISFGGKEDFSVTVSIAFGSLMAAGGPMLARCTDALQGIALDERNLLVEVDA